MKTTEQLKAERKARRIARKAKATQPLTGLTQRSLEVFLEYANSGVWSGNPLVRRNVGGFKEERAQLKKAGLITTEIYEGCTWIYFTNSGKELARKYNVKYFLNPSQGN